MTSRDKILVVEDEAILLFSIAEKNSPVEFETYEYDFSVEAPRHYLSLALGSVHAMSHPAGAHFGVPHGVANCIHLPHVIRHNAQGTPDIADRYRDIGEIFDVTDRELGDALADYLTELSGRLGLPTRLSQVGVPEDGIPALVEGAMGDGTTLLNPREMSEEDYAELYRRAL